MTQIAIWIAISGLIGFAVGFWLGHDRALRQCVRMIDLLRVETEMYMQLLNRGHEEPPP